MSVLTPTLAAALFVAAVAFWSWQEHLLAQLRRLQARHRALTEKSTR